MALAAIEKESEKKKIQYVFRTTRVKIVSYM